MAKTIITLPATMVATASDRAFKFMPYKDEYENIMRKNLDVLEEALK